MPIAFDSPQALMATLAPRARVFVHAAAATPSELLYALAERRDLQQVELYHLHLGGELPDFPDGLFSHSFFVGANLRKQVQQGRAEFIPVFLSDIPSLFQNGAIPLDVALVQVSPPDRHGYCSLGTSVEAALQACLSADRILAMVNPCVPRTHGNSRIPFSKIDGYCQIERPIYAHNPSELDREEREIGHLVSQLIEHGSTLQMGIGAIPDAVLAELGNKLDLGVHTEMFSDGLLPLLEGGVVTNRYKKVYPGRTVTSFAMGSQKLYDYVDDNPSLEFHPCDHTNDTAVIRKNPKVCAINSALQMDLSGQVCADSLGYRIYSGVGGQLDFMRGAALSPGGKAILAMTATASGGKLSRITSHLNEGAGVVTTRAHLHWVVTEFGAVNLHGKNLRQRAEALIGLAHPDFRSELTQQIKAVRHFDLAPLQIF